MLDVVRNDTLRVFNKFILVEGLNKAHDISHKQRCDTKHYLKCAIDCFQHDADHKDFPDILFAGEDIGMHYYIVAPVNKGLQTVPAFLIYFNLYAEQCYKALASIACGDTNARGRPCI